MYVYAIFPRNTKHTRGDSVLHAFPIDEGDSMVMQECANGDMWLYGGFDTLDLQIGGREFP